MKYSKQSQGKSNWYISTLLCLLFEHWVSSCPIHLGLLYRKKNPNCLWGEAGVLKSAWAVCGHHGKQTNTSSIQGQATVSMITWYFKTPLVPFWDFEGKFWVKKKSSLVKHMNTLNNTSEVMNGYPLTVLETISLLWTARSLTGWCLSPCSKPTILTPIIIINTAPILSFQQPSGGCWELWIKPGLNHD